MLIQEKQNKKTLIITDFEKQKQKQNNICWVVCGIKLSLVLLHL